MSAAPTLRLDGNDLLPVISGVTLTKMIGRGGMGAVYAGEQEFIGRKVAVKLLTDSSHNAQEMADRFRREAKILASLTHPHIVSCFQAGTTDSNVCFLVMELVEGVSIKEYLETHGVMPVNVAVRILRDMACALEYARERGIIHRDVKPENILLQPDSGTMAVRDFPFACKLVDLGLARHFDAIARDGMTVLGVVLGTPPYMAPEQFNDPDGVDHRADIYALGCVIYRCLSGEVAFPQKTLTTLLFSKTSGDVADLAIKRPDVSEDFRNLLRRMMAPNREDRPQEYREMIAWCDSTIPGQGGPPSPASGSPTVRQTGRTVITMALVALAIIATAAVMIPLVISKKQESAPATNSPPTSTQPPAPVLPTPMSAPDAPATAVLKTPVVFRPQVRSLLPRDFLERLGEWDIEDGKGKFSPQEEGNGIIGFGGMGSISRPLPSGPLLLEVEMSGIESGASCGLKIADIAVLVTAAHIGQTAVVSLVQDPGPGGTPKLAIASNSVPADQPIRCSFTVDEGTVIVAINDSPLGVPVDVNPSAPRRVLLVVEGEMVQFDRVGYRTP